MVENANLFQLRKSVLLITCVSVAATLFYGCYFDAGGFQDDAGQRASAANVLATDKTDELGTAFTTYPNRLTDEDYVAAAMAWEKKLQASCQKGWQPVPPTDHYAVYDAMTRELKNGLAAIGNHHPGLRLPMEAMLEEAAQDLPTE